MRIDPMNRRRARIAAPLVGVALALAACAPAESAPARAPLTLALATSHAGNPTVALDGTGAAAYVAWVAGAENAFEVYVARIAPDGLSEGEPVRVNATPGDASLHEAAPPQVVVGPRGEVYVAWESSYRVEGRKYPASNLRFARSVDGGRSFGPSLTVNSDADGMPASHTFHNLAVAPDGTIYVSWIDSRRRDLARAGTQPETAASSGHGAHGHGGHATAGQAHGAAAAELPGSELWLAVSRDRGQSFHEVAVVDRNVCPCCRTGLAIGSDGAVYVVWRKIFEGDVRDIAIASSRDGGATFTEPVPVHRDGWVYPGCPHAGPSIAVGADNALHVAWYTGKDGAQGTYYAASADGGQSFSEPVGLLVGEWVPPSIARVAVAGDEVWIAWDDRREDRESRRVSLARVEHGRLTRQTDLRGTTPDLALAGGWRVLAWHQGDGVQLRIDGTP